MITNLTSVEQCASCGSEIKEQGAFCHFYPEGRQVTLCGPTCAEAFLRGSSRGVTGDAPRNLVEELVEERRWRFWRS
jgi:hypothetical protein